MSDLPKLYNMAEAAAYLKIGRRHLCRYLEAGAIGCYRPSGKTGRGSRVLFTKEHLEDFLKQNEQRTYYDHIREMVRTIERLHHLLAELLKTAGGRK